MSFETSKSGIIFCCCIVFLLLPPGCSQEEDDRFVTDIDGNRYETVRIGSLTWMAENLRVTKDRYGNPLETYCYRDKEGKCKEFGRLYPWEEAKKVSPDGWRLPTAEDWKSLEIELGMDPGEAEAFGWTGTDQGKQLKEGGGSGFNALLAGYKDGIIQWDGRYFDMGYFGAFWSATGYDSLNAVAYWVYVASDRVYKYQYDNTSALSVRCVRNE